MAVFAEHTDLCSLIMLALAILLTHDNPECGAYGGHFAQGRWGCLLAASANRAPSGDETGPVGAPFRRRVGLCDGLGAR